MTDTRRAACVCAIDLTSNQSTAWNRARSLLRHLRAEEAFDMSGPRISSRIAALISRFRRDSKANIAVIFAIALVPIITMIGCATDYSLAVRMKAKMQSAADGASVASISQNSAGYLAATQMTTDGSVPAGVAEANNIFTGNVNGTGGYQSLSVTSTVTKTRAALRSNVQFSAQVPTIFLNIIGYQYL